MKYAKYVLTVLVAMVMVNLPAQAYYTCSGPVTQLGISNSGTVVISLGGIQTGQLCQIGATANGVSSDVCKAIYAQLLTAQVTGQSLTLYFSDNLTCSTQPQWGWLTGYYFGPSNF